MNRPQELLLSLLRPAMDRSRIIRGQVTQKDRELSNLAPNYSAPVSIAPEEWPAVVKEANRYGLAPYLFHVLRPQAKSAGTVPAPPLPAAPSSPPAAPNDPFTPSTPSPPAPARPPLPASEPLSTSTPFPVPPDSVLDSLRRAYLQNASVNLQRFHFLGPVLRALSAAGVPVIVLKGGYLAEAVYGNIALRTMSDIDILVKRDQIASVAEALRSAGFEPRELNLAPPPDANEFHFFHRKNKTLIEPHWKIFNSEYPFDFSPAYVWPAAVPARIAGSDVLALSPEDLLCHLAVHAGIHSYNFGIKAIIDCAEVIDRLPVNWDRLVSRARLFQAVRPVWLYLILFRRLLAGNVPEEILVSLRPSDSSEAIIASAVERLFPAENGRSARESGNPNLILLFGRKGIRAKLLLGLRRMFPSRAAIASQYPVSANSPRILLYYPKWMWAVLKRNAPSLRARFFLGRREQKALLAGGGKASSAGSAALMDWLMRAE